MKIYVDMYVLCGSCNQPLSFMTDHGFFAKAWYVHRHTKRFKCNRKLFGPNAQTRHLKKWRIDETYSSDRTHDLWAYPLLVVRQKFMNDTDEYPDPCKYCKAKRGEPCTDDCPSHEWTYNQR